MKRFPKSSKLFLTLYSVIAALIAAAIVVAVVFTLPAPSIKIAVKYPQENIAVVVTAQENQDGIFFTQTCDLVQDKKPGEDTSYEYPDWDKSIDFYENVVLVKNPMKRQIVFREQYPIDRGNGTEYREILVYGDGRIENTVVS